MIDTQITMFPRYTSNLVIVGYVQSTADLQVFLVPFKAPVRMHRERLFAAGVLSLPRQRIFPHGHPNSLPC